MHQHFLVVFALLLAPSITSAQSPDTVRARSLDPQQKPPWEWTVEERLEAQKHWNVLRHEAAGLRVGQVSENELPALRGRDNPELLFPSTLFREFIHLFYTPTPDGFNGWRELYAEGVKRYLGPPEDVYYDLEVAAAEMIWIHRRCLELAQGLDGADAPTRQRILAELQVTQERSCRARFEGLENAKSRFGSEALYRFLYEVVAPNFTTGLLEGPMMRVEHRSWVEEGCQ